MTTPCLNARLWPDERGKKPSNYYIMLATVAAFEAEYGQGVIPTAESISAFLVSRQTNDSKSRIAAYALRDGLGLLWGENIEQLAQMAQRDIYVSPKDKKEIYQKALSMIACLPAGYAEKILPILEKTRHEDSQQFGNCGVVWSADHVYNTCISMRTWLTFCERKGLTHEPSGKSFCLFADALFHEHAAAAPSIVVYLSRIRSVFERILSPQRCYFGASFIQSIWENRAKSTPYRYKTADQLVGAAAIFRHGLSLVADALEQPLTPLRRAIQMRNGLVLSFGTAFPERARALGALEWERTLWLEPDSVIVVSLPGAALKQRQTRKKHTNRDVSFRNADLWSALNYYMLHHRRVIDDSAHVFPSTRRYGAPLSVAGLRALVAKETLAQFGVAIPTHRLRDNVATEAVEFLDEKGAAATALLNHRDPRTALKHYDHSTGIETSRAFNKFIAMKQGPASKIEI